MTKQSTGLSPSVYAFLVLILAFLLVGLYVSNRDLETAGVTAQDVLLPNVVPATDAEEGQFSELTIHYPDGWNVFSDGNGYTFTLQESEEPVEITFLINPSSVEQLVVDVNPAGVDGSIVDYRNPLFSEEDGARYSVSRPGDPGQPDVIVDNVLLGLPDQRTVRATLRATANTINDHREVFELMLSNLEVDPLPAVELVARDSVEAPELPNVADDLGTVVVVNYPDGWSAASGNELNVTGVFTVDEEAATQMNVFLLEPELTPLSLGLQAGPEEMTPTAVLDMYQATLPGSLVVQAVEPATLGGYEGVRMVQRLPTELDRVREVGIFAYNDELYLSYSLTTVADSLGDGMATADAMLATVAVNEATYAVPARDEAEPLALEQSATSVATGITYQVPESWLTDASRDPLLSFTTEAATVIFVAAEPESMAVDILQLPDTSDLSPMGLVDQFLGILTESGQIAGEPLQPATVHQAGDFEGASFVTAASLLPGQVWPVNVIEFGIMELPDGRLLTYQIIGANEEFAQLRATVDAIVASLEFADTDTEATNEEDTDESADEAEVSDESVEEDDSTEAEETSGESETEGDDSESDTSE